MAVAFCSLLHEGDKGMEWMMRSGLKVKQIPSLVCCSPLDGSRLKMESRNNLCLSSLFP